MMPTTGYAPVISLETQARNIAARLEAATDHETAAKMTGALLAEMGLTAEFVAELDFHTTKIEDANISAFMDGAVYDRVSNFGHHFVVIFFSHRTLLPLT